MRHFFNKESIQELIKNSKENNLSIYTSFEESCLPENKKDRFRKILSEAKKHLMRCLSDGNKVNSIFNLIDPLIRRKDIWEQKSKGFVVFANKDFVYYFCVPVQFNTQIIVQDRFFIRPLVPLFPESGQYIAVDVCFEKISIFQGTKYDIGLIKEIKVLKKDKQEMKKSIKRADSFITSYYKKHTPQLILAGNPEAVSLYRSASSYSNICKDAFLYKKVQINKDKLYKAVLNIAKKVFYKHIEKLCEEFENVIGTGRDARTIGKVVQSAHENRVAVLFIAKGAEAWGRVINDGTLRLGEKGEEGVVEMIDYCVFRVLEAGGKVIELETEKMPHKTRQIAALLKK